MKEGSTQSTGTRSHGRLRSIFVAGEITLALVLVIASVLTLRSFNRLLHTDLGFNPDNLLTARIGLPDNRYSPEAGQRFFKELLSRLSNLHGVQSVAATAYVPLGDGGQTGDFQIEGRPSQQNQGPFAENHFVTTSYFQTLQIPLLRGRLFTDADRQGAPKVVVVNDYLARQIWPGQDAVGKRLGVLSAPNDWSEVVGVVADVKAQGVTTPPTMQIYLSTQQRPVTDMYVVIRAAADAGDLLPALKHTVFEMDSQQPVSNVAFMDQLLSRSLSGSRGSTFLLGIFAALAMLLAGIGIYAVMAYSVSQRSREIGIRIALGATLWDIHGMVIGMCMRVCAWGLGAGLLIALGVTRFLRSLLFGISATDVTTFASSALLLAGAAVLASYIPARRAAKVDPVVALRYE
jgi:putative ABC transport system permease protein